MTQLQKISTTLFEYSLHHFLMKIDEIWLKIEWSIFMGNVFIFFFTKGRKMTTHNLEQQLSEAKIEIDSDVEENVEADPQECWQPIEGYPKYEVSNFGRVRSIRVANRKVKTHKILKAFHDKDGYPRVNLYNSGLSKQIPIHKLVAKAFIPNNNPKAYTQVDHRDRCKVNNHTSNLRWVDSFGNQYNRADRPYDFVDKLGPEFVQIRQYGRHVFDRLFYDGSGKFYMYIDEATGYREIVPAPAGNSYCIYCIDVSRTRRGMGLIKLTNYAIILLTEKYGEIVRRNYEADNITGVRPWGEDESDESDESDEYDEYDE